MRKRTWHYVMKPWEYEIHCDKCDGVNIEWSEYEHMIWCYDCKIDTPGTDGLFDGLIGWGVAQLLGTSFNRWNMKKQRVEYPRISKNHIRWYAKREKMSYTREHAKRVVGPGWSKLIDGVFDRLHTDAVVADCKEKFGGLRMYVYNIDEDTQDFIDSIEDKSLTVCEECGKPGEPREGGWIKTLCDEHAKERHQR